MILATIFMVATIVILGFMIFQVFRNLQSKQPVVEKQDPVDAARMTGADIDLRDSRGKYQP